MRTTLLIVTAALLAASPAWAINKCTGPDGKVTYQEIACPTDAKADQKVKTWQNSSGNEPGSWKFVRKLDDMTGKVACMAMSPITSPKTPAPNKFIPVHMVVAVTAESELIGLRTSDNSNLFHNDLSGMGVKTDSGPFIPLSIKAGSHVVGVSNSEALIGALSSSRQLLVRARFWPFEQLYDMEPISSAGFASAINQARTCAGRAVPSAS